MSNQFQIQIKSRVMLLGVTAAMSIGALSGSINPAFAGHFAQNHPRRAEVLGRDNRLNNQVNNDRGHLGGQYGRLKSEDSSIRSQEQADARANGGHITRGEQAQLNREENGVQRQIDRDNSGRPGRGGGLFAMNHPRRAEVLGRDNGLNRQINGDAGHLNGQYGQLKSEDQGIRAQEQTEAGLNGGYITRPEQHQLNREENQLQRQVNRDNSL